MNISKDALLLQHRTAFALFLKKGLDEVKKLYPESVQFVQANKGKTLKDITVILTEKLGTQSEMAMPLLAR